MWGVCVMSGPQGSCRFAKRRVIDFADRGQFRTPMLVPSYSSKGFPKVADIIAVTGPYIESQILVSAYDVHHGFVPTELNFPPMVFLDSGGYESAVDHDLSEQFLHIDSVYEPLDWTEADYEAVVSIWPVDPPTVFVSYDHPHERLSVADQIARALRLGGRSRLIKRELLLKPSTPQAQYLKMDNITAHVSNMSPFAAIGVTEKEIGKTLLERMVNIGKLRRAMEQAKLDLPIHVFGSLDTTSTLLYFVMGADIFDGLTWLRYAYHEGRTVYRQEFAALKLPPKTNYKNTAELSWQENYFYLRDMEVRMSRFLRNGDFSIFGPNASKIEHLYEVALEELEG
eukprot:TRINITY_DN9830_c0_g1_i1.p1 TRINITY_DN9830_c0_g1~~TRINITY_DN9830_c0_g1_i1.p1  ORF type:complete len:341 (+),score=23.39 TRINITY_DN9830_c0_g1_i1:529-1551(+)